MENVIELKTSVRKWIAILFLKITIGLVLAFGVATGAQELWSITKALAIDTYSDLMRKLTKVEIVREFVQPMDLPPAQLIEKYSKELKVPRIIGLILLDKESGGGSAVYRFEPKVYDRLKSKKGISDSEIRMLASSHGPLQVMGFNAQPRCNIHWSKLYGPDGVFCGLKIMRENLTQHKAVRDIGQRAWLAFRDYNGSGPDAERYADHAMSIAGRIMLQQWEREL